MVWGAAVAQEEEQSSTDCRIAGLIPQYLLSTCHSVLGQDDEPQFALQSLGIHEPVHS